MGKNAIATAHRLPIEAPKFFYFLLRVSTRFELAKRVDLGYFTQTSSTERRVGL